MMCSKLLDVWPIKLLFAIITALFSPFKISLIALCAMIIIDTITGCIYAIEIDKFSSRGFRKAISKIIMYFTCILVVRLLEEGIAAIFTTTYLTDFIIGYLIINEFFSCLENLTLLGAPIPPGIGKRMLNHITNNTFKYILDASNDVKKYTDEISDMLQYQLNNFKDEKIKKGIEIQLKEWIKFITLVDVELEESQNYSNELLIYKVIALINATNEKINEYWIKEELSEEYIKKFNEIGKVKIDGYLLMVKDICEKNQPIKQKKNQIIDKLIIILYQTLLEMRKPQSN